MNEYFVYSECPSSNKGSADIIKAKDGDECLRIAVDRLTERWGSDRFVIKNINKI